MRALEERGIGRPSTYAAIMGTILDRGYVRKEGQALVPSFLAFAVTNLLEQHFGQLVDYEFTAPDGGRPRPHRRRATEERSAWLRRFYFGNGDPGLKALVSDLGDIDARAINTIEIGDGIELRIGRYGPYLERDGQRATVPDDIAPDELTVERAEELLSQGQQQRELGVDPETGRTIVVKTGRYGPYVTEVVENGEKPRTASLFKSMSPETRDASRTRCCCSRCRARSASTRPTARRSSPRTAATGPYIKKGAETRSLESEEQLLTMTLDEALALLAQPKQRGRRAAAAPPLRELGADPGQRQADRRQERPLRPVCHRRRD